MEMLTQSRFAHAQSFMKMGARALEKALFEYEFEGGSAASVLEQLSRYQNQDGGFHGLEPDIRTPVSSAISTSIAFQILDKLNGEGEYEEIARNAIQYLIHTYRQDRKGWDIIPREADESPRAIWWNYGAFDETWGNPNAELAGYLYKYRHLVPSDFVQDVVDEAMDYVLHHSACNEMHEMYCYLRLAEQLPEDQVQRMTHRIDQFIENCVIHQPEEGQGYGAYPLQVAESPDARYFERYAEVIPGELDRLIESQSSDGSWGPNWAWGRFEDEWPAAREEWKGIVTLNHLRILRAYGRIQE